MIRICISGKISKHGPSGAWQASGCKHGENLPFHQPFGGTFTSHVPNNTPLLKIVSYWMYRFIYRLSKKYRNMTSPNDNVDRIGITLYHQQSRAAASNRGVLTWSGENQLSPTEIDDVLSTDWESVPASTIITVDPSVDRVRFGTLCTNPIRPTPLRYYQKTRLFFLLSDISSFYLT